MATRDVRNERKTERRNEQSYETVNRKELRMNNAREAAAATVETFRKDMAIQVDEFIK